VGGEDLHFGHRAASRDARPWAWYVLRTVQRRRHDRGPGKLEGSIVNWINAPIFQLIGERSGFEVTVEPFAYREVSNISVLSARHRDAYRRPSTHHDDHELATEARDAGFGAVVA
jgi:hypothetical protein